MKEENYNVRKVLNVGSFRGAFFNKFLAYKRKGLNMFDCSQKCLKRMTNRQNIFKTTPL